MAKSNNKKRIEAYVTEKEYDLINKNKETAGFKKLSSFIGYSCLNYGKNNIPLQDVLILNDFLQEVRNDSNKEVVDDIFNRFNKYFNI